MRAAASRGLVRRRPSSSLHASSLGRQHGAPRSSFVVRPTFPSLSAQHKMCCNHFSSSFSATTSTDDIDISIQSQPTADDVLLSKYTQITDRILSISSSKETGSSISSKQRFEALEAASYWTRLQTVDGADRAAKLLHRLYDDERAAVPIEQVAYCIDVYRAHSGSSYDVQTEEGSLAARAEALLARAEEHSGSSSPTEATSAYDNDDDDDGDSHLTTQAYNMVLDCYAKIGDHKAVERIMNRMDKRCQADPLSVLCSPDTVSYNTLLKALSNSNDPDAPMRSEEVFQRMQNMADAGDPAVRPNVTSFSSVISCWGRSSQEDGASRAEQILHRMLELSKDGRPDLAPSVVCFGSVIDAWAKSGASDSAERVDDIIGLMVQELGGGDNEETLMSEEDDQSNIAITSALDAMAKSGQGFERAERFVQAMGNSADNITFTVLIDSFARSGLNNGGEKAEAVLSEMISSYEAGNAKMAPTVPTFNAVLNCYSKSKQRDAGKRAFNLLQRMKDIQLSGSNDIKPDAISFASCIDAFANSGAPDAGRRSEELLAEMDELYKAGDESMRPNLVCYSAAINAWACSRDRQAGRNAEALLKKMQKMYASGNGSIKPNEFCFGATLDAHAKGGDSFNAERFFAKLEALYKDGDAEADPRKQTYVNSVIDSIVRGRGRDAPLKCQAFLERMKSQYNLEPCVRTKNSLINSIAKSNRPNASERAESILMEMLDTNDEESMPSTVTFNICIDAWSKSRHPDAPNRAERLLNTMRECNDKGFTFIKPDTVSFTACIVAWGKSRHKDGAERSEAILTHMQSLYEATGDESLRPNVVSLSAVVSAWSNRSKNNPEAAQRALDILEWAYEKGGHRGIRPNTITYNSVITALSRSRQKESAQKGHDLLDRMKQQYRDGDLDVKPSRVTYNSLISCYASTPQPNTMERVDGLLEEMKRCAIEEDDNSLAPDVVTYGSYFGCLAKSRIAAKAEHAYDIVCEMEQKALEGNENIRPNILIYGQILRCSAFTKTKDTQCRRRALKVAMGVLSKIRDSKLIEPLPNTYELALWSCCVLTRGEELKRLLERIFRYCCEDGCLSDEVLRRLRTMAPTDVVQSLIGNETKVNALPSSWSCHARRVAPDKRDSRQFVSRERELRGERRFLDARESRNDARRLA